MRLKKYKEKNIGTYLSREIILIVIGIIMAIGIINYYYRKFNKVIMIMAEENAKSYLTKIVNEATKEIKFDKKIFNIVKDNNDEIKMINFDTYESTRLTNEITYNIQDKLDDISIKDNGYIIGEIPLGIVFNNGLIRNIGPKIKIRVDIIGNILTELNSEIKPYGINNALIQINVKIVVKGRVVLPIESKNITIENTVPISINVVNGSVPDGYIGTYK